MRNRILPMTVLVIWCLSSGAYLHAEHIMSKGSVFLFLCTVLCAALGLYIIRDRRRLGAYNDGDFFAAIMLCGITGAILVFRQAYLSHILAMSIITAGIVLFMIWTLHGVKPSGLYLKLTEASERRDARLQAKRAARQVPSSFDDLSIGPDSVEDTNIRGIGGLSFMHDPA